MPKNSILLLVTIFLFALQVDAQSAITAIASASMETCPAQLAVDGDPNTRWISAPEDNQWWQADFDSPRSICGIVIKWEYAHAEKYAIEVKSGSGGWHKVYETGTSDGNTDIIHFEPVTATAVKLECIKRGTGSWAFSIWEIGFIDGKDAPILTAGSDRSCFTVSLPKPMPLGGIILKWGEKYPVSYFLEATSDGKAWKEVYSTARGKSGEQWDYFDSVEVSGIRINCGGKGFDLLGYEFKGSEEKADRTKPYLALSGKHPGEYPMWLSWKQEFWTVVGIPIEKNEGVFSETGAVEPFKNGFSVMPFVLDGKKLRTALDCKVSQSLQDGYLPIPTVRWETKGWDLKITAVGTGTLGKSHTAVRYSFTNNKKEAFKGKLALVVRPLQLNPTWQHGGFSPIDRCECLNCDDFSYLRINGQPGLIALSRPLSMAAMEFDTSEIMDCVRNGSLPDSPIIRSKEGAISAAVLFSLDLKPGQKKDILVAYPMEGGFSPSALAGFSFESARSAEAQRWSELTNRVEIRIPEKRLTDVVKSNLAYVLINKDGPWIQPGSRNYSHSWIRDGALTGIALMRMGLVNEVRDWLEAVATIIPDNGYVPFMRFENGKTPAFVNDSSTDGKEFDSQGEYPYAVRNYFDYSHDIEYLKLVYPKVLASLKFARDLRHSTMTEAIKNDPRQAPNYGILPGSNSHEGYYPGMHSYWDDFFVLRGIKDAIYLAELLGDKENASMLQAELTDFSKCLYDSLNLVISSRNIDYIPGCTEKADFDATSTAIAVVACGELDNLPKEQLKHTFDRYYEEFRKGTVPGHERTFTPYEVRSANAFVRMGQRDRALAMLRYLTASSVRPYAWNHMAELVHANPREPSYIGDMPHTWVGSGFIDAVRTMLVYESGDKLILCAGIDADWLKSGVTVKNLPTNYGMLSYSVRKIGKKIEFSATGTATPPGGMILRLPTQHGDRDVAVPELPAKISIDPLNIAGTKN
ncbi:MAG: discoidin domain-containing protein [Candidatus Wallbacteria bacterium]|nr:discoidin domain-containing protein [Candidatus Wallbacteria bacterium]